MKKATPPKKSADDRSARRQILGFSLDPGMARDVKTLAAQNGVSLKKLFEDMWAVYKKQKGL